MMEIREIIEFFELVRALPPEKQKEFYYMVKGAAFVAEKSA